MHILVSEKLKTGMAAASFIRLVIRAFSALLCCSFFAIGPAHSQADPTVAPPPILASPVTLSSGTFQGVWRDEDGVSGGLIIELSVDGKSIKGKLTLVGVEDYSGDRIRGSAVDNADGTLGVEVKTRDGFWKTKAVFDGQLLIGTYDYKFYERRIQQLVKGEWAAQRVPD